MKSSLSLLKHAVPLACASLLVGGTAQAALEDRDLNGDTVVDAFYDKDLDITWLRDANVNGKMNWDAAVAWANGYSFGGYSDWRLPTSDTCSGYGCVASEMGHLWYVELGNPAGGPVTNTGNFQNLKSVRGDYYWSGLEYAPVPSLAWRFRTYDGYQLYYSKSDEWFAMAVADGDIGMVPESGTYALMLAGLAGLALARRRRQR